MQRGEMERGEIEELAHTADIGFRITAPSLPDLFRLAAEGLVSALGLGPRDDGREPPEGGRDAERISLRRESLERLLVAWLRELLRGITADRRVPRIATLEVREGEEGVGAEEGARLEASVRWIPWGERAPDREIKGVTYHGLEVCRNGEGWHATVVLDV